MKSLTWVVHSEFVMRPCQCICTRPVVVFCSHLCSVMFTWKSNSHREHNVFTFALCPGGNSRKWWHCQQSHRPTERDLYQPWTKTTSQSGAAPFLIQSGLVMLSLLLLQLMCLWSVIGLLTSPLSLSLRSKFMRILSSRALTVSRHRMTPSVCWMETKTASTVPARKPSVWCEFSLCSKSTSTSVTATTMRRGLYCPCPGTVTTRSK